MPKQDPLEIKFLKLMFVMILSAILLVVYLRVHKKKRGADTKNSINSEQAIQDAQDNPGNRTN